MHPFRVFISYSHADRPLVVKLVAAIERLGLSALWDRDIRPGTAFTESIKESISTAHLFIPLITPNSNLRPWVHQETGYAMGLNIPVLPVAVQGVPGEMIAQLHAVSVCEDLADIDERLAEVNLDQLILPPPSRPLASSQVADLPERRTELLVQYSNHLLDRGTYGHVRQRAIFSSFSLPDRDVTEPIWNRLDDRHAGSPFRRQLLREERRALDRHAQMEGCSLIINPLVDYSAVGADVHRAQLETLIAFLSSLPDKKARIALSPRAHKGNLTLVGDWFVAQAVMPQPGLDYQQTHFCGHAPTVLRHMRSFDQEMAEIFHLDRIEPAISRQLALDRLNERYASLPCPS